MDTLLALREHTGSPVCDPSLPVLALVCDRRLGRTSGRGFRDCANALGRPAWRRHAGTIF